MTKTNYLYTHEALKGLWELYWDARMPNHIPGAEVPKENVVSLKIKTNIEQVTRAMTEALNQVIEEKKKNKKEANDGSVSSESKARNA